MRPLTLSFEEFEYQLSRVPLVASFHPLTPVALAQSVQVLSEAEHLIAQLDDRHAHPQGAMLITDQFTPLRERVPWVQLLDHPPVEAINLNMASHLEYMRSHLLTNHQVADLIRKDVEKTSPNIVVLFLVDGLSYGDTVGWPCPDITPCFVDGPSVTFRLMNGSSKVVNPEVGFPALIGRPSIRSQLQTLGYRHARGYTYWSPGSNVISDYLFEGIPYQRIANFESILSLVSTEPWPDGSYLQIVREGLDGLAHSKRELQRVEIEGALQAIWRDIERLLDLLLNRQSKVALYVVADHGILWKTEHSWRKLNRIQEGRSRYSTAAPHEDVQGYFVRMDNGQEPYFLCKYPYLVSNIPADDSGVHGGLSYQESFVPFIRLRG
jgi:hypothetical protein